MKNPTGFGVAVMATASLAIAGGEGEKKGEKPKPATNAAPQGGGWSGKAGGGLKYSGQDFSVKLKSGAQVQFNYMANDGAVDSAGFNVRRARTAISGHIHKEEITYKLQADWREGAAIKDAWIDWKFHNTEEYDIGLRAGQLKPRFGREHNTSWNKFDFIDRSLATRTFANRRTRGGMLHGSANNSSLQWSLLIHNTDLAAGANNSGEEGDPRVGTNDESDNELNYTVDVSWTSNPKAVRMTGGQGALDDESGYGFGIAYTLANGYSSNAAHPSATNTDTETDAGNVWAQFRSGGINALAEYFMREEIQSGVNDLDSSGYQCSVSWTAAKVPDQTQWGCGLRYSHIELDNFALGHGPRHLGAGGLLGGGTGGVSGREVNELEFVVNMFYHGHAMKTQAGITYQQIDDVVATGSAGSNTDNYIFSLQTTFTF